MMNNEKILYKQGFVHKEVFVKLSNNFGIKFGELKSQFRKRKNQNIPEPEWNPAKIGRTDNGFKWIRVQDSAEPVEDIYIKKFDLLRFAFNSIGKADLIKYAFNLPES